MTSQLRTVWLGAWRVLRQHASTAAAFALRILQAIDPRDVFLLGGLLLLWWGLFQIWKPLSYVVIGALLIRLAVWTASPAPNPQQEQAPRHGPR